MNRIVRLTPPRVTEAHISEKITCIRAHRERLFYVGTQKSEGKLVCHNYGHGGAGWTFLFGCVNEAIRQFEQELSFDSALKNKPICIVGAGCYGLLTAIELIRRGFQVRIVAKETTHINSHKAAGFFFPRHRKCSTPEEITVFRTLGMESYRTYLEILTGRHSFLQEGPRLLSGYYGLDIDPGFGPYIEQGLVAMPEQVTIDFSNGKSYTAMEYKTVFINPAALMEQLQKVVAKLTIPMIVGEIASWEEISESIIFNCTGLGAKKLTEDRRIVPIQGHLITLKDQPPLEQLQYMINVKVLSTDLRGRPRDELIYYAPKDSGILGITFIRGQDSLIANAHEFDRLLQRCQEFFGS